MSGRRPQPSPPGARGLREAAAGLAAIVLVAAPRAALAADAAHPTVVELFQSQGCSSCPPANANVMALADRSDLLTLSWQVTYWDQLGWKDTFGSPLYTARQWDYAHAFHRSEVATPEVVVNGRADVVGQDRAALEALIRRQDRGDGGPRIAFDGGRATVSGAAGAGAGAPAAVVVLVRYDPAIVQVPIQRGENGGRTLPHRNVVRQVAELGEWRGGTKTFDIPPAPRAGLRTAILVQSGRGGPILAAARS